MPIQFLLSAGNPNSASFAVQMVYHLSHFTSLFIKLLNVIISLHRSFADSYQLFSQDVALAGLEFTL